MFKGDYKWQHDYVRLATDTGFYFERHKSENFDKNKISSIDIDRIIEERDIASIENIIPSVTKFVLDQEQAQILDPSFVKTFRLSQLVIQYLLYCKKYLDNTLIIVKEEIKKVKEENKELNLFVEDLQTHISNLMKEIDEKPTFKCDQCNKIFSSEDFLNSHIKRRHSIIVTETETNKLEMEIKALKGRLNSAEQKIQREQNEVDNNFKEVESKKIEELQQKFEDLRLQVQSELKILQTQHQFQEKYEKWFEKMALQGHDKKETGDLGQRRESTTQTELEASKILVTKLEENVPKISNTQKQMTEFGEALETKVTSSLEKIENQMQSFWNKLNEMETYKKKDLDFEEKPKPFKARSKYTMKNLSPDESFEEKGSSPKRDFVKARSKYTMKNLSPDESFEERDSSPKRDFAKPKDAKLQHQVRVVEAKPQKENLKVQTLQKVESDDTISSETIASESEMTVDSPKEQKVTKPHPVPRKRLSSNSRKKIDHGVIDEELLGHFRIEVEKVIMGRLQDLGVSPEWKGLPTRSFQRAIEIINHQANLMKKNCSNFDFISTQIEKNVSQKLEESQTKQKPVMIKPKTKKVEKKPQITKKGKAPSPKIEIKNRKMYDTDSESEAKPTLVKETLRHFSAPYSAVIEELKTVTTKIDSDSVKDEMVKNDDHTKGVLKSYPSVGSLTKKKVLFNLETDVKKDLLMKDGGSSTSITSSVFDGTPRQEVPKKKDKDIEDLSDFDLSDM